MKLKYDFVVNCVAGETIAVSSGSENNAYNGYLHLNQTAAFIFEMLKNEISREEIISALKEEYPNEPEQILCEATDSFLKKLEDEGLLI